MDLTALSDEFWRLIDQRIERIAAAKVGEATRNLRYGGPEVMEAHIVGPVEWQHIGDPPAVLFHVGQQCQITSIDLYSAPGEYGTAVLYLATVRQGLAQAAEEPLFSSPDDAPVLTGLDYWRFIPTPAWRTFLESECSLLVYITSLSDITVLNIAINVKAL